MSQRYFCQVWVFSCEEEDTTPLTMVPEFLVRMSSTITSRNRSHSPPNLAHHKLMLQHVLRSPAKQLVTKLTKFIAATGGVSRVQLHADSYR